MRALAICVAVPFLYFVLIGAAKQMPSSGMLWPLYSGDIVQTIAYFVAFLGGAATIAISR